MLLKEMRKKIFHILFFRLSQVCNHEAAILFKLEYVTRLDMSDPACTSAICQWDEPSKSNSALVSV